jgi:hypothetical protein
MVPISLTLRSALHLRGLGFTPGDVVVGNRYAEARPNAAAMIAADWSGGAIKTSFFEGQCRSRERTARRR